MNIQRIVLLFLAACMLGGCGYNAIQVKDEATKATWSEVISQYKRRADLVPLLIKNVQEYAKHEEAVFTKVAQARASVGKITLSADDLGDVAKMQQFQAAQGELSSALSRLMAVSENYPDLKANIGFQTLQAQLEGTENRIAVARSRYIEAVQDYNVLVRKFPQNLTAKLFGYHTKATFTVENEKAISEPPKWDPGEAATPASPPPAQPAH